MDKKIVDFDIDALFEALDTQRISKGLSWAGVAKEMWLMAEELNRSRQNDHPLSPSTIVNMSRRGNTTCQHALIFLQWLGRSPESFLCGVSKNQTGTPVQSSSTDRRPRWDLRMLYAAINIRRQEQSMTWAEVAQAIGCSPNQLTGLSTARYATNMKLAMRIVQWLERPAAAFIYLAKW
jgi:DNA-binding XRE family transcriptional regulator